ncbi:aldo/keto reductase [Nonomuraea ferruginea]|uniref:Aldo/keto reductase n=1 Tax=Nonomuraea ferruginea TaxID=46174 RepID=A0ABT4SQN7_9ACTN|nr:aldo/keto reductase [Nonomuraea ferruginea]MDA0639345.1 aldo/keto reductase [Nonomuraea ferruginea]
MLCSSSSSRESTLTAAEDETPGSASLVGRLLLFAQQPIASDARAGCSLRRAVELGVNHIDTAGFYGRGAVRANELIRTALTPYRDDLVIATKVGPLRGPNGVPSEQATPDQLRGPVEADLRSLGLDRLELAYLRVGGMGESIAERFAVVAELRAEGLLRHLGVSDVDAAQFAEAQAIAPVAAVQNRHTGDTALGRLSLVGWGFSGEMIVCPEKLRGGHP